MILQTVKVIENFSDMDKLNALAREAFPPAEYLPPSKLIKMSRTDGFDFFSLYDGDKFVGFMTVVTHKRIAYLFFLAIDKALRGGGYGSLALETLRSLYPNFRHVVDFEMVEDGVENNEQRKKRRRFYLKNGYLPTGHFLSYLGVDYEIFCTDKTFDLDEFRELMSRLKIDGFHPKYFEK